MASKKKEYLKNSKRHATNIHVANMCRTRHTHVACGMCYDR